MQCEGGPRGIISALNSRLILHTNQFVSRQAPNKVCPSANLESPLHKHHTKSSSVSRNGVSLARCLNDLQSYPLNAGQKLHPAKPTMSNPLAALRSEEQADAQSNLPRASSSQAAATDVMGGGESVTRQGALSERAERVVARSSSPYYAGWKEVARNPYDKVTNPEGCIQLGLAENMVSIIPQGPIYK